MNTALPTLYYRADCPFCWKVRIALAELGIQYRSVETQLGEKHPDVLRLNPKGTVPVYVDDESEIWESSVIIEYLLDGPRQSHLLPGTPGKRSEARLLHSYSDSVVGPALRDLVFEKRSKPQSEWDRTVIDSSAAAWRSCQRYLENFLAGREYFVDRFSFADCALLARFGIADYYGAAIPSELEGLRDWFRRGQKRSSYINTYPVFTNSA